MSLNNAFVFEKFYWDLRAYVIAGERMARIYAEQKSMLSDTEGLVDSEYAS
jgi:hypothetical protein